MRELGERLRGFRLRNGWSKRTVARRLGVSTPSIMRWEQGSAEPNDYNRYKIERLLSTTDRASVVRASGGREPAHVSSPPSSYAQSGMR
jgi:transcriptional regulator with XRE-family HTH domain